MNKVPENNIQNEDPENSSPLLSKIKTSMQSEAGFKTPEGYFDSLSAEVMKKIESLPEFDNVAKSNPFQTPDGYFDELPSAVQQRIIDKNKRRNTIAERIAEVFAKPAPKYALAFASVLIVLFFSIKYFNRTVKVEYVEQNQDAEQLDAFYLSQLDETVLAEVYEEGNVASENIPETEIENYLLENDFDLNSISEQL